MPFQLFRSTFLCSTGPFLCPVFELGRALARQLLANCSLTIKMLEAGVLKLYALALTNIRLSAIVGCFSGLSEVRGFTDRSFTTKRYVVQRQFDDHASAALHIGNKESP